MSRNSSARKNTGSDYSETATETDESRDSGSFPRPTQDRDQHEGFTGNLKEAFGKLAEAVTGKPTPTLFLQRRKRRGDTRGAFNLAAVKVALRVFQDILDFLYEPQHRSDRKAAERFARFKRGPANDTGDRQRPRRATHHRPRKIDPKRGPC